MKIPDNLRTTYPNIARACDATDCEIMSGVDDYLSAHPVEYVWIGWPEDFMAGLWGGQLTRAFRTLAELDAFLSLHITELEKWPEGYPLLYYE